MIYKFHAYGHPNILGTHKTTLEFTKDEDLTSNGNCIIGVKADFELSILKEFIKKNINKVITITIETSDKRIKEAIHGKLNPGFNSNREIVIRKTDFLSGRTLMINSNKSSFELDRNLIDYLKEKEAKITITIEKR